MAIETGTGTAWNQNAHGAMNDVVFTFTARDSKGLFTSSRKE